MSLLLGGRFQVIKYAESFQDALAFMHSENLSVDLVIGDPGAHGAVEFDAISEISSQFSETKVVVTASQINQAMLDALIQNGADGVLTNDISVAALLYSLEIVMLGERIVPTILSSSGHAPNLAPQPAPPSDPTNSLSNREQDILNFLVDGLPNKSIARNLDISEATVKVHLKMLLRKLRVQNRTQAAVWALNNGHGQNDSRSTETAELRANPAAELTPPQLVDQRRPGRLRLSVN